MVRIIRATMNRRTFIANQGALFLKTNDRQTGLQRPVSVREASENNVVFLSQNKKLLIETTFADSGDSVTVYNDITWEDPVTNTKLNKKSVDMYILDAGTM